MKKSTIWGLLIFLTMLISGCSAAGVAPLSKEEVQNSGIPLNLEVTVTEKEDCGVTVESSGVNTDTCPENNMPLGNKQVLGTDTEMEWPVKLGPAR